MHYRQISITRLKEKLEETSGMVRRWVVLALLRSAFSVDRFTRSRYIAQETQTASGENDERSAKDQSAPRRKKAKRNSQSDSQRSAVNREGKTVSITATMVGLEGGTLHGNGKILQWDATGLA